MSDLPEADAPGRLGANTVPAKVSRVRSTNCVPSQTRDQLRKLDITSDKRRLANINSKYKHLPDIYYGGDSSKHLTPEIFTQAGPTYEELVVNKRDHDD